jgi:hypothetical protein
MKEDVLQLPNKLKLRKNNSENIKNNKNVSPSLTQDITHRKLQNSSKTPT